MVQFGKGVTTVAENRLQSLQITVGDIAVRARLIVTLITKLRFAAQRNATNQPLRRLSQNADDRL